LDELVHAFQGRTQEKSEWRRRQIKLIYTKHVLLRMVKRELREEWIERVVRNPSRVEPDEVDPALEHRLAPVPELANRVLRVIVSKDEPKRVITAHLDRKMKGKL
jgi:hypothetical protein